MELFFREEGKEGKKIVIVHGLYGSSDNWLTVAKKLGVNHHVYLVDQRNHGHSPKSDVHTYESMKEDLAEFFEKHKLDKSIVIGHSMGGKSAMAFAADYPEHIEKLVVVDIAPKDYYLLGENSQYYQHQYILQTLTEVQQNSNQFKSRDDIANFLQLKLDGKELVQFLLKSMYRDKETKQFKCRLNIETLNNSLDEIISGVDERYFSDRIPIMKYPVLFIKGEQSEYIREEDFGLIRKIYPEALLKIIPNAGHWLHAEQPVRFMEALQDFI
ncbi:MAG: alpha/beta fold hydrolase [Mangrovibacterium sp.]